MERTALYKHYDDKDILLYVGISLSSINRFSDHKATSEWAQYAMVMKTEWYDSRREAVRAETAAIKGLKPLFNKVHNRTGDREQNITDYILGRTEEGRAALAAKRAAYAVQQREAEKWQAERQAERRAAERAAEDAKRAAELTAEDARWAAGAQVLDKMAARRKLHVQWVIGVCCTALAFVLGIVGLHTFRGAGFPSAEFLAWLVGLSAAVLVGVLIQLYKFYHSDVKKLARGWPATARRY